MTEEKQNPERMPSERIPKRNGRQNRSVLMLGVLIVVVGGMFAFAFANAEFFVIICQKAGFLSTPPEDLRGTSVEQRDYGRSLDVYFSARSNDNLPITFTVDDKFQKTNIGKTTTNYYKFTNQSDRLIYFKPVHDIFPTRAGFPDAMLLTKCFCFDLQKIEPRQSYTLPVEYTFTEEVGDEVRVIRMSYSLFESTKEDYESWMANAEEREAEAAEAAAAAAESSPL